MHSPHVIRLLAELTAQASLYRDCSLREPDEILATCFQACLSVLRNSNIDGGSQTIRSRLQTAVSEALLARPDPPALPGSARSREHRFGFPQRNQSESGLPTTPEEITRGLTPEQAARWTDGSLSYFLARCQVINRHAVADRRQIQRRLHRLWRKCPAKARAYQRQLDQDWWRHCRRMVTMDNSNLREVALTAFDYIYGKRYPIR